MRFSARKRVGGITMKRLVLTKKEICTIPNYLTFLRVALVPVYMTLLILGAQRENLAFIISALGVMLFASLTDVFDGWIARKFNQGSYVGQCIDPIADKVMHIGAIVALAIAGYLHWAFIIFIAFREFMMVFVGSFIVNKVNIKANMLGKVASATISVGVMACFFHPYIAKLWGEFGIDWIIVTIGLVLNWSAAVNYAINVFKQLKQEKAEAKEKANSDELATQVASDETVSDEVVEDVANSAVENNDEKPE